MAAKKVKKTTKVTKKSQKKTVTKAKTGAKKTALSSKPSRPAVIHTRNHSAFLSPLDDRIVVEPQAAETKTAGGLIIPNTAQERPGRGRVMAKGPGHRTKKGKLRPLDVKVGDEILYTEMSGTQISHDGQDFLILREEDVLGVVTV